jgi:hypothetical protein
MNKTKRCCVCKNDLSLDSFYNNKCSPDGLQNRCKACDKKYQKLDNIKEQKKIHKIERYDNDINYQISNKIRSGITKAIKYNFKKGIAVNLLGCSIVQYKNYLESKFTPDMNWDNYKTVWEIDHIIEICTFNLTIEENINKCFHYTNTQPLYKIENRRRKSPSVLIN